MTWVVTWGAGESCLLIIYVVVSAQASGVLEIDPAYTFHKPANRNVQDDPDSEQ